MNTITSLDKAIDQKQNNIIEAKQLNNMINDVSSKLVLAELKKELEELLQQKVAIPAQ
ncbi:MAG: hypothetical protein WCI00_07595 [bacterium]